MTQIAKSQSWQMFNDISAKYDLLNRFLSLGLDIHWRKCLSRLVPSISETRLLDCATGTGDVILSILNERGNVIEAKGIDMAAKMLEQGRAKLDKMNLSDRVELVEGDINQMPFAKETFDVTTIAFGIRNVDEPQKVLSEMYRVLKKGGMSLILEFSLPRNRLLRAGHLFYLRTVVPCIGGLVSGHYQAYKYLNKTIEMFPYGQNFLNLMTDAGYEHVTALPLMGGVATIYRGEKR